VLADSLGDTLVEETVDKVVEMMLGILVRSLGQVDNLLNKLVDTPVASRWFLQMNLHISLLAAHPLSRYIPGHMEQRRPMAPFADHTLDALPAVAWQRPVVAYHRLVVGMA
jgi:hypothetical protein